MDIEFLKERAKEFFEEAEELLKKKRYNLSAFNLEQAIQLWIKSQKLMVEISVCSPFAEIKPPQTCGGLTS